jgi:hypothetical protein
MTSSGLSSSDSWARWLALAWMGYHVVLSAFHNLPELVMHSLFLIVFVFFLLRASADRYFRAEHTAEEVSGRGLMPDDP